MMSEVVIETPDNPDGYPLVMSVVPRVGDTILVSIESSRKRAKQYRVVEVRHEVRIDAAEERGYLALTVVRVVNPGDL